MHYSFNSMLGRLSPTTRAAAYTPQGLQANVVEAKPVVFANKNTVFAETNGTSFSSQAKEPAKGFVPSLDKYAKQRSLQTFMTHNDHRFVWIKRLPDTPLLFISSLIGLGGLYFVGYAIYNMSYGTNKKS